MNFQAVMDKAARSAIEVVGGIRPEQLDLPTPCVEWNVRSLANHLVVWSALRSEEAARTRTQDYSDDGEADHITGDWARVYERRLRRAVAAWAQPGAWEGMIGEMPAPMYGQMMLGELVVHGWDLARATGQELAVAPEVAEAVHAGVVMFAEQGREYKIYGEPVPVPDGASVMDKALALSGRDPNWSP